MFNINSIYANSQLYSRNANVENNLILQSQQKVASQKKNAGNSMDVLTMKLSQTLQMQNGGNAQAISNVQNALNMVKYTDGILANIQQNLSQVQTLTSSGTLSTGTGSSQYLPTLEWGDSGSAVNTLQNAMTFGGYAQTSDGSFGNGVQAGVKQVQADNGLSQTGVVDAATWNAIYAADAKPKPAITNGSSGNWAASVQTILTELGYNTGGIDGSFGPTSTSVLKQFQTDHGLAATGVTDTATWNMFTSLLKPNAPLQLEIGAWGSSVAQLQTQLGVTVDESFGTQTQTALKNWQSANGLSPTGVFDTQSYDKMFNATTTNSNQSEINQLLGTVTDQISNATYNGKNLFQNNSPITVHEGYLSNDNTNIQIPQISLQSLGLQGFNAGSTTASTQIQNAMNSINSQRATLGGYEQSFTAEINRLQTMNSHLSDYQTKIESPDNATELSYQTKHQMLYNSNLSLLTSAQTSMKNLLKLFN